MKISLPEENVTGKEASLDVQEKTNNNGNMAAPLDESTFPHYKRVSDYLLGTCVGEGSFAKVREALHTPTHEKVAVKIINKAKARRDSYVYKNLHREGRLLQMLRHPNIVQVFDILETGNNYYLVTELCNGGELIDIVTEEGSLSEETVCNYTKQLVDAVGYMQDRKIVHRDLKVENLLLDSEGNLKIIDFGLSNIISERNSDPSSALITQCGSPAYAAPELLAKKSYGPKVDVWSIGIITYALLVGKLPFTVDPFSIPKLCRKMMRGEMNPIAHFVSSACRNFIRKLLTPDHNQRPSIREVARFKWLSMFTMIQSHGGVKDSLSGLFLDTMERSGNIRRRSNILTPLLHPLIDSSIVKEMSSSFGFASSDVIQSVQKNRPGPALATYHLLSKRKSWRQSRSSNAKPFEKATFATSAQANKESANPEQSGGTSSVNQSTGSSHQTTSPMQNQDDKSSDRKITTPDKTKRVSMSVTVDHTKKTSTQASVAKNNSIPLVFTKPKLANISVATALNSSNKKSKDDNSPIFEKRGSSTDLETSIAVAKQHRQTHPDSRPTPLAAINSKSPTSEVSDMLASMRKARQVLEKKQQLNQHQQRLDSKKFNKSIPNNLPPCTESEEADTTAPLEEEKSLPTTLIKQSKTAHKVLHSLLSDQRSASQQGSRPKLVTKQSPFKRPSSHNSVLHDKPDSTVGHSQFVPTLRSPQKWKLSTNSSQGSDKPKPEANSPNHSSTRTNSITLPRINPKTSTQFDKSPYAAHLTSLNSKPSANGRSYPASHNHFSGNRRFVFRSSTDSNSESIAKEHQKTASGKTPTVSRWQKPSRNDESYNFMPRYNYYAVTASNKSPTTQRPKKVISEPIAATISYLTTIKQKTFNKEKPTSITTG